MSTNFQSSCIYIYIYILFIFPSDIIQLTLRELFLGHCFVLYREEHLLIEFISTDLRFRSLACPEFASEARFSGCSVSRLPKCMNLEPAEISLPRLSTFAAPPPFSLGDRLPKCMYLQENKREELIIHLIRVDFLLNFSFFDYYNFFFLS